MLSKKEIAEGAEKTEEYIFLQEERQREQSVIWEWGVGNEWKNFSS